MKKLNLKNTYILYIFLGILLPGIFVVLFLSMLLREQINADIEKNMAILESSVQKRVNEIFESSDEIFHALMHSLNIAKKEDRGELIKALLEHSRFFEFAGIVSEEGILSNAATTDIHENLSTIIGFDLSGMEFFKRVKRDDFLRSEITMSIYSDNPTITYATKNGKDIYFADLNLKKIAQIISDINVDETYEAFLVDNSGKLIFNSLDEGLVKQRFNVSSHPLLKFNNKELISFKENGVDYVGRAVSIAGTNWLMAIYVKKDSAYSLLNIFYIAVLLGVVIGALFLIFFYKMTAKNLFDPIVLFSQKSEKIAQGDYSIELPEFSHKELELLSQSFRKMIKSVHDRESELRELNKNLQHRVDQAIKKEQQHQLIIQENLKNEAMGELLLNLAHQWRQPLNIVAINMQNIEDIVEFENADKAKIGSVIEKSINELSALSKTISELTSYYKHATDDEKIDIEEAYKISKKLTQHILIESRIEYRLNVDEDFTLKLQKSALIDILFVMILNLRDIIAMRTLNGATLDIVCIKEGYLNKILIKDNAGGIDTSLLPTRLFEPYVTTNFKSREKGLGLYNVKNLVTHSLKGSIFATNSDVGAQFELLFQGE